MKPPQPIDSPGRSGSKFFLSYDKKVVLKSISSEEVALLHQILQPYHEVWCQMHTLSDLGVLAATR